MSVLFTIRSSLYSLYPRVTGLGACRLDSNSNVALTFDDGPHEHVTREVLEALEDTGLRATFFVCGFNTESRPKLLRSCLEAGHDLGIHGYRHERMMLMKRSQIAENLQRTKDVIRDATGVTATSFRPPYGSWNPLMNGVLRELGLVLAGWNRMPVDYISNVSVDMMHEYFERTLKGGDIILLHDNPKTLGKAGETVRSLAGILRDKGLETCSLVNSQRDMN